MAKKDKTHALRVQIENNRQSRAASPHLWFVPEQALRHIFTRAAIDGAVAELNCQPEDLKNLSRDIELSRLTAFAVLVWMGHEDAVVNFRRFDCLSRLPLEDDRAAKAAPDFWKEYVLQQWHFIPHCFRIGQDLELDTSAILPFVREGGRKEGGYATIATLEIHHDLHNFQYTDLELRASPFNSTTQRDRPVVVVRKTLLQRDKDTEKQHRKRFEKEKRALTLLSSKKHSFIIPLLAAYVHGQDFCFLFPKYDMDLREFFERSQRYGEFELDFTFFSAVHGLATALKTVHDLRLQASDDGLDFSGTGYHHDLRPANILVGKGSFVLADFGMSRLKPADQDSVTPWKVGTGDYIAPECMNVDLVHQDVGRGIDTWAFGCLLAEVAVFMQHGSGGLSQFCNARLNEEPTKLGETSYFHGREGHIKNSVRRWLEFLLDDGHPPFNVLLHRLILKTLVPVGERLRMAKITDQLAYLSVTAHFFAVLEQFGKVIGEHPHESRTFRGSMKLWFERERLRAFGNVLSFDSSDSNDTLLKHLAAGVTFVVDTLVQLFQKLRAYTPSEKASIDLYKRPEVTEAPVHITSEASQIDPKALLELNVQRLVQGLWDILPSSDAWKAESIWINAMLHTDDVDRLNGLQQALGSESAAMYQDGAALVTMRKIRLEMTGPLEEGQELRKLEIKDDDVEELHSCRGHQLGRYQDHQTVIVEWMYYNRSWDSIPVQEQTVVMALKAKGFNVENTPKSLRLLSCIGFIERQTGQRPGYGFVYQTLDHGKSGPSSACQMTTLLHLLEDSMRLLRGGSSKKHLTTNPHLSQPFLQHKFRLAHVLAESLMNFHSVGWLHENFHSDNIVFLESTADGEPINPACSKIITEPYVLGLHKSRPGGQAWHTQGPAADSRFLDYQHPDYEKTRRFRCGYDYFSFGLILLEIGLWTPLRAWSTDSKRLTMTPHELRNTLVERYVPRLGPRMGETYQEVVHLLLTDKLDPEPQNNDVDRSTEDSAFRNFFDEVLVPLRRVSYGLEHEAGE